MSFPLPQELKALLQAGLRRSLMTAARRHDAHRIATWIPPAPRGPRRRWRALRVGSGRGRCRAVVWRLRTVGLAGDRGEPARDRRVVPGCSSRSTPLPQAAFFRRLVGADRAAARGPVALRRGSSPSTSPATRSTTSRPEASRASRSRCTCSARDRAPARASPRSTLHKHSDLLAQWLFVSAGRRRHARALPAARRAPGSPRPGGRGVLLGATARALTWALRQRDLLAGRAIARRAGSPLSERLCALHDGAAERLDDRIRRFYASTARSASPRRRAVLPRLVRRRRRDLDRPAPSRSGRRLGARPSRIEAALDRR